MLVTRGAGGWALAIAGWLVACHGDTPSPAIPGEPAISPGQAQPAPSPDGLGRLDNPAPDPREPTPSEPPAALAPASPVTSDGDAGEPAPDAPEVVDAATPTPLDAPLPPGVTSRFPRGGQSAVCSDAPLRLTFAGAVAVGARGSIRVSASARPGEPVDVIDLAAPTPPDTLAGRSVNRVLPIFIDGNDAVIYLRRGALAPDTSYDVSIEAGVFVDAEGRSIGDTSAAGWSFRTGAAPSSAGGSVRVAREGGDVCTIQGAFDAIPGGDRGRVEIVVQPGAYHELLYLSGKREVTLRGTDAATTVISYPNNERLNPGTASRAMVTALNADDLIIEGLTLHNTTPQGGGQAETLRVSGERVTLRDSRFLSLQDTLLLDGTVYVADSLVEGNVDFVWGYGSAYFERSEIKVVGRPGVIVQARNGADSHGYVFVDSRLTSDPNLGGTTLARIDASVYPNSEVAYIDCQLGPHITAEGWTVTGDAPTTGLRFLEFGSTDLSGRRLDVSQRHPASRQLDAVEASAFRDRASVLGGWDPGG